jgi:transposase
MTPEDSDSLTKADLVALIAKLSEQNRVLGEENALLKARIAELEARLKVPPKTPDNSSLPPSRGEKANRPESASKPPRKGRPGVTRELAANPDRVREVYASTCSSCGERLSEADQPEVARAYDHIDVPPVKPITTRIHLHRGRCPCCGKQTTATAPADMPIGSPFGPGIVSLVVYFHYRHMISYIRLAETLKELFSLSVSQGAICNMLERAAAPFAAAAQGIEAEVRGAAVIACDETSARVEGQTCWQWVFGCAGAVSHRIAASRGAAVVTDFLQGAKPEVWVSDRLAAQRGHAVAHQVCLAHLLRDAQFAIDAGDQTFAPGFQFLLKRALAIGRRRETLADATLIAYRRDLEGRLHRLLTCEPTSVAGRKLRNGIDRCRDKLFVFVTHRDVPPTNNASERALRPSVIFRKVTNGFRSVWGSAVYADICSVIATGAKRDLSAIETIRTCLAGRSILAGAPP